MESHQKSVTKKRIPGIDLLKAIAMLMVVCLHSGLFQGNFIQIPNFSHYMQYGLRLLSEGVPLFVAINGYLLLHREGNDLRKMLHRILKLIFLLLGWALFMILVKMMLLHQPLPLKDIAINFLQTNISNKYDGVLWFLQNLIALYFVVPLIKLVRDKSMQLYRYFFTVAFFSSVGLNTLRFFTNGLKVFSGMTHATDINTFISHLNPLGNADFIFFFLLGDFIWQYRDWIKAHTAKLVAAAIIFWGGAAGLAIAISWESHKIYSASFNYGFLSMVMIIIAWFAVTFLYKGNNEKIRGFVEAIGNNTMGIYLIHTILIVGMKHFAGGPFGKRLLFTLGIYFASFLLSWLIMKVPYLKNTVKL